MTDRQKIVEEIERLKTQSLFNRERCKPHTYDWHSGELYAMIQVCKFIAALPQEPEPIVRWRTVEETPVGIDEEFHTSLEGAEEYLESMAGHYPSKITKCEIREVKP